MEAKEQAAALLGQAAGFVGTKTIEIGLTHGLFEAIREAGEASPDELAKSAGIDSFYAGVWCRAGFGAGVLEGYEEGRYRLAPHIETLLLDHSSPAYLGGLFKVMNQPEMFPTFSDNLKSGERIWWDQTGPGWIEGVSETGGAFNTRFIPGGIAQIPPAQERLEQGGKALELACGTGVGLIRLATQFPDLHVTGLDGDAYSLRVARSKVDDAGLGDRVELIHSTMEDLGSEDEFDAVTINVSMHECRDIEAVTAAIYKALKPGGFFLNSDFPFPDSADGLRSVPGRIMSGVQFFEALIDDQLLPVAAYLELFERHGFQDVGVVELTPVHAITYGKK